MLNNIKIDLFLGHLPHNTNGIMIGVSLSEPHTSVTALRTCVCVHACLLACLLAYYAGDLRP